MKPSLSKNLNSNLGFTIIELLVSISIIGVITAIVVFNQGDFSDRVSLNNVANEIDLQIREAQVYGTSVREYKPSTSEFNVAYGVHFNLGNTGSSNSSFISFVDRSPQDGLYGTPTLACTPFTAPSPECVSRYNLTRNNTITDLCVIKDTGDSTTACYKTALIGRIDITFVRPNPNAVINFFKNDGTSANSLYSNFLGAKIELTSPKSNKQYIYIYTTGQISIQ
jgi:prepilin-type N-terminal cleavage/methylation domain-containing protein